MTTPVRTIRAPRGTSLTCKGWLQEAALRMLMHNLDPDVAERPNDLVYGGTGRHAGSVASPKTGIGVIRRADAGDPEAIETARARKVRIPMREAGR